MSKPRQEDVEKSISFSGLHKDWPDVKIKFEAGFKRIGHYRWITNESKARSFAHDAEDRAQEEWLKINDECHGFILASIQDKMLKQKIHDASIGDLGIDPNGTAEPKMKGEQVAYLAWKALLFEYDTKDPNFCSQMVAELYALTIGEGKTKTARDYCIEMRRIQKVLQDTDTKQSQAQTQTQG